MRCVCDDDDVLLCTCYVARERYVVFLFHEIQSIYARRVFVGRVPSRVARLKGTAFIHLRHESSSRVPSVRVPFARSSRSLASLDLCLAPNT